MSELDVMPLPIKAKPIKIIDTPEERARVINHLTKAVDYINNYKVDPTDKDYSAKLKYINGLRKESLAELNRYKLKFSKPIIKTAAPKWAKEFLNLSPEAQQKIVDANISGNERQIKHLGSGGERVADLVVHPEHGLSVRKVPKLSMSSKRHIDSIHLPAREQREMEYKLREIAKGKGDFAHIKGHAGNAAYYDYVPGGNRQLERADKYWDKLKAEEERSRKLKREINYKKFDLRDKKKAGTIGPNTYSRAADKLNAEYSKIVDEKIGKTDRKFLALRKYYFSKPKLTAETEATISKLREHYPGLHDIRKPNVVGGKIVDLSPNMRSVTHTFEGKLEGISSDNFSRKHALSGRPKAKVKVDEPIKAIDRLKGMKSSGYKKAKSVNSGLVPVTMSSSNSGYSKLKTNKLLELLKRHKGKIGIGAGLLGAGAAALAIKSKN